MFDNLKAMGALAGLMKNKDGLRAAGERVKRRLTEVRAAGQAGGGAVRVTTDGQMRVVEVVLDPALVRGLVGDPPGAAQAAELIRDAVNEALRQSQALAQREVAREAEALGLPEIPGLGSLLGPG
ncbi:MAG TPA: YbaB/EbfC family nucleoid-associated protein [Phycisphaerales bacterium]|nr:YbaB/EbfC family nucleoid-associated protein [Phycisphaerales bacterium]